MVNLICLIPLLPLAGFLINGLGYKSISKTMAGLIGAGLVLVSFIFSIVLFLMLPSSASKEIEIDLFNWISAGDLTVSFGFLLDPLSSIMLLIVTGVGFLIHLYSIGYMHDDAGFNKFFAYLNLFMFSMLLLVLGNNYLVMFIGWEGVGLCSYLLIGFWFKNVSYTAAANKAFIMNRIGDLGFLLGIFMIYQNFGSLNYKEVFTGASGFSSGSIEIVAITLLLFIGAAGKSAQVPLYTWLPDAMAGPTPVSALIHAATMVTAGIYMIIRSNVLYALAPFTLTLIAVIGIMTALLAAIIALTQTDIKKVLAYSTVSQLGLMFLALGCGAFTAGLFHVMTHAFFKALLFLGAGSVIHAMGGEQDIRNMGSLKSKLPITWVTFFIATLAISGVPPFAGFFSKDEILAFAYNSNPIFWVLGIIVSIMTAFYMFRLFFLTFYGNFRGTAAQQKHLHESPMVITIPLIILALFSTIGGFFGIPEILGGNHWLHGFLGPVLSGSGYRIGQLGISHSTEFTLMFLSIAAAAMAIFYAHHKYVKKGELPSENVSELKPAEKISYNKFYVDELYQNIIVGPLSWFSRTSYNFIETKLIDGFVNGVGQFIIWSSNGLRMIQSGSIVLYIFMMVLGAIAILFFKFYL